MVRSTGYIVTCILLSIPSATPLARLSDVNVPVEGIIEAIILKHTDWVCHWLFADWEVEALQGYGIRTNQAGVRRPVVLSQKARQSPYSAHHIQFSCIDNRTTARVDTAIIYEDEVPQMGPYYLACDSHTEQLQLSNAPRYDYEGFPIHRNHYRKVASCVTQPLSTVRDTRRAGVVVHPNGLY